MKNKHTITTVTPTQCHIWQYKKFSKALGDSLHEQFDRVKEYLDESHDIRRLLKCRKCGQLYYYSFYEEIDWANGNDPQYRTWIPVASKQDAEALSGYSPLGILEFFPRLQSDWPSDAERPRVYWNKTTITK